ncbi:MAG: flavodoxin family protein [Proteobacteria bacterium]|nr:MAG: flavodoxin family protein [Pseudomonadota bacterium]
MKKKIVIIYGHPDKESYCYSLGRAYMQGAMSTGAEVKEVVVTDLEFNPNLKYGFRKPTPFEPDLLEVRETINWADHLVWVYPLWWGSVPALLKGFIDRMFIPGFAFNPQKGSRLWDSYLKGKSSRIIYSYNNEIWYTSLFLKVDGAFTIKTMLKYCGVKPIKVTSIGRIRLSEDEFREKWLKKVQKIGTQMR